jgi:hypothetical protein
MVIRYIFPRFGMLHKEKSGNPAKHEAWARPKPEKNRTDPSLHIWDDDPSYKWRIFFLVRIQIDRKFVFQPTLLERPLMRLFLFGLLGNLEDFILFKMRRWWNFAENFERSKFAKK